MVAGAEGEHLEHVSARQVSGNGRAQLGIEEQVGWNPPLPLAVWP